MALRILAALALACVCSPAWADAPASVVIPYGDIIVGVLSVVTQALVPVLVAVITAAIAKLWPWASLLLSEKRIEDSVQKVRDFGMNAVTGAAKGKTLDIPLARQVLFRAAERSKEATPPKVLKRIGGPEEMAKRVFRTLDLAPDASAENVLAPVVEALNGKGR